MEFRFEKSSEVSKSFVSENKTFDPDKRIDVNQKHDIKNKQEYDVDKRVECKSGLDKNEASETGIPDKFYTSFEQRENMFPTDGEWTGDPGNSKFISNNSETNAELAKYGLNGIEYKNGVPDFSKCSILTCKIEQMTPDIETNFKSFAKELVSKGYFDKQKEVLDYKRNNNVAFHECSDTHTCQLVPEKIHQTFTHTGGRLECRERDIANGKGGLNFDN